MLRSLSPTRGRAGARGGGARPVGPRGRRAGGRSRRGGGRRRRPRPRRAGRVRERQGEGLAGLAGDLLTSGEPVLVVVADVARRRAGLERTIAGMAPDGLAVASWDALGRAPAAGRALHAPAGHGPAAGPEGVDLLAAASGRWLRPPGLGPGRDRVHAGLLAPPAGSARRAGRALARAQRARGPGRPRAGRARCEVRGPIRAAARWPGGCCGCWPRRAWSRSTPRPARCWCISSRRTSLDASPAFRAYAARLAAAEAHLAPAAARIAA